MKYSKLLLSTILAASIFTAESASAKPYKTYAPHKARVTVKEANYSSASQYISHVNNARIALNNSRKEAALEEINLAYNSLSDLEINDGSYRVSQVTAGRKLYHYLSSDNYYYFPLEVSNSVSTKDYLYAYQNQDDNTDLQTVYLSINPNNTDSRTILSNADELIRDGYYMEADEALAELIHRNILTEKVVALSNGKARLDLISAKYYLQADNVDAAINNLDNANVSLRSMISSKGYYQRSATLEQIRDNALALRKKLANGTINYDAAVEQLDSWISQLTKIYKA